MTRRGQRLYWAGAESKIYAEPKRLESLGYLASRRAPGKTRERTTTPTRKCAPHRSGWRSRRAFRASRARRRSGSRRATSWTTRASCSRASPLREEILDLTELLEASERREAQFPHRQVHLRLLHSLGRRILRAHLEWLDEVERELRQRE